MIYNKKNKILFSVFVVFIIIFSIFLFFYSTFSNAQVTLGGKTFLVEVVSTPTKLERGLSGHLPLKDYEGMLFIFPKPDIYRFWMKEMLFPIDIIWIDENWHIIHVEKSLKPETYPTIFYSKTPALRVLEVSSGESERLNLKVGDSVKFVEN